MPASRQSPEEYTGADGASGAVAESRAYSNDAPAGRSAPGDASADSPTGWAQGTVGVPGADAGSPRHRRVPRLGLRATSTLVVAAVALLGIVLAGCASPHRSLADLVAHQETYDGRVVTTSGTVRRFEDPSGPYYVLEDADGNRVEVTPASSVEGRVGEVVSVTGRFSIEPMQGRVIAVDSVSPSGG